VRQDLLNAIRRLIREELTLLRQLGRDRRIASARMPTIVRTGPAAILKREAA
jgi:hypothetical protein